MLMPAKVKHRKVFRGKRRGIATKGNKLEFGDFGLQSLENDWITARQIEAGRIAINRFIKRGGKLWIRTFPVQTGHQEAGRSAHGQGQGRSRSSGSTSSSAAASSMSWRASAKTWPGKP